MPSTEDNNCSVSHAKQLAGTVQVLLESVPKNEDSGRSILHQAHRGAHMTCWKKNLRQQNPSFKNAHTHTHTHTHTLTHTHTNQALVVLKERWSWVRGAFTM